MHPHVTTLLAAARTRARVVGTDGESPTAAVAAATVGPCREAATHGTFVLRCLTPADAHHMKDLLDRLSARSRYLRYLRLVRSFTDAEIARFVAVGPHHLALGAFDGDVLVGAAQYFRSSTHPEQAEIAIEVTDTHHRRGVGARLVQELSLLASGDGITRFTATVLADNRAVLGLMRQSGRRIAMTQDGPYIDVVVTLPRDVSVGRLRGHRTAGRREPRSADPLVWC